MVDCLPQLGAETDQAIPLLVGNRNSIRQLAPKDLVLDLQITDLSGQFFLRGPHQDQEQTAIDVFHGDSVQVFVRQADDFIFAQRSAGRNSCRREAYASRTLTRRGRPSPRIGICQFRSRSLSFAATKNELETSSDL